MVIAKCAMRLSNDNQRTHVALQQSLIKQAKKIKSIKKRKTKRQASIPANQQTIKPANYQTNKLSNYQTKKPAN